MSKHDTLILCGDCDHTHRPSEPPKWEYTERFVKGWCQECDAELIRVPRNPSGE